MSIRINDALAHTQCINLTLEPSTVAELFWNFDNLQQAEFFNTLAATSSEDGESNLAKQMELVRNCDEILTLEGANAMSEIGSNLYTPIESSEEKGFVITAQQARLNCSPGKVITNLLTHIYKEIDKLSHKGCYVFTSNDSEVLNNVDKLKPALLQNGYVCTVRCSALGDVLQLEVSWEPNLNLDLISW